MSGNTGKMTAAAIEARGPRLVLTKVFKDGKYIGSIICSQIDCHYQWHVVARSYSLSYLLHIAKYNCT